MKNILRTSAPIILLAAALAGCVASTTTTPAASVATPVQVATAGITATVEETGTVTTTTDSTSTATTTSTTASTTAEAATSTEGNAETASATTIVLGETIQIEGEGASISDDGVIINAAGSYTISGTLADGMVEIDAPGATVEVILDGVTITHVDGPALLFTQIEQAIVTIQEGTTNTLTDGGDSEFDAVIYSNNTLTIRGAGDLYVNGTNNEGISSTMHINIEGGNIWVHSVEDGVNANNDNVSKITISGGYLYIETESGDGIDSNGTIDITGGTIISLGALVDANGGLDADGAITISGGTVIATGTNLSTPVATSPQKSILVSYSSTQAADTLVSIQQDGTSVLTFAPAISYEALLYSSADIADGVSYDVYTGGSSTGDVLDGVYSNGEYTPGTLVTTITTESVTNARNQIR